MARKRVNVSSPKGATASKAAPVGSSLLDESSGSTRSARVLSGSATVNPGYRLITNTSNSVVQPRIVKSVDPSLGQGPAKAGGAGRYANMNDRVVKANIVRAPRSGTQGVTSRDSRVVRPARTAVRIGTGGHAKIRNV